jgi:hypothetical protein
MATTTPFVVADNTHVEQPDSPTAAPHPEEMKGTVTATFGKYASFTATGRTTPAGVISVAILTLAVFLPLIALSRRR